MRTSDCLVGIAKSVVYGLIVWGVLWASSPGVAVTTCGAFPTCNGMCPAGQVCSASGQSCVCEPLGCCQFDAGIECFTTTQTDCDSSPPTNFVPDQVCLEGSACVTATPTVTPTSTPVIPCGSFPPFNGPCPAGQACSLSGQSCVCEPLGCCQFDAGIECFTTTKTDCDSSPPTDFVPDQVCLEGSFCVTATPTSTPTSTPTATPSATPTNARVPDGGSCMTPAECASFNCVNGTCDPSMSPAPAASTSGLAVGLAILIALGGIGMWRAQRRVR